MLFISLYLCSLGDGHMFFLGHLQALQGLPAFALDASFPGK